METFKLVAEYQPTGDQPTAINQLVEGIKQGKAKQVLLGATGTGKTFTISNVIAKVNKPTLILAHNKTLAGQLYSEFKAFFPENRVEYFISNFDFYQPEAYMPRTDTYIEKSTKTNKEIEMLRSSTVNSLLERNDTIVVASVAAIYGASNPDNYREMIFGLRVGEILDRSQLLGYLVQRQYSRNDIELTAGTFRVRGDVIEIMPGHTESYVVRIELFGDEIERITEVEPLTGKVNFSYNNYSIYPADDYATNKSVIERAVKTIGEELEERIAYYKDNVRLLELQRIEQRVRQDMEMLAETGVCSGIENYSRHIDGRKPGVRPYTLFDYFPDDFLLVVDESHVMLPQIRGMYNGDKARKETLVDFGFRLPSALDNRPLKFDEFNEICHQSIYVSATPGDYELEQTNNEYAEQIIRPTGLLDPIVEVRPSKGQIDDIVEEIRIRTSKSERTLITTLTKKMAEDLTDYLKELGIKVAYMHSDTKTLERTVILRDLRLGKYDVLVGINLLREGLDLPEVSLILILDADKEGFLRSNRSLIQIIGRAARNAEGRVIMYADKMTSSMEYAINETNRRRKIQEEYNEKHGIIPTTITKKISDIIGTEIDIDASNIKGKKDKMGKKAKEELIIKLQKEMKEAAKDLNFERATELRDIIFELQAEIDQ